MATQNGWIGVDLDGTLARYSSWRGIEHIGEPIPLMLNRVKQWIKKGIEVRIVTARHAPEETREQVTEVVQNWCLEHCGKKLPVTHEKDLAMLQLWDDRCVQVVPNTGERVDGGQ